MYGKKASMEMMGVMTRFDPISAEVLASCSPDGLTIDELREAMGRAGLKMQNIVHDATRHICSTYYADFERGVYRELTLSRAYILNGDDLRRIAEMEMPASLINGDFYQYYTESVPLPMTIYDFVRRYKEIPPDVVFQVWHNVYKRITYSNGMWPQEVLDFIFGLAPKPQLPMPDRNGEITIYRGMGELSQPPLRTISWSTHPGNALWFAIHSGRGTGVAVAKVKPEQIVAYFEGFQRENEVIVRPGTIADYWYEDMIPVTEKTVPPMLIKSIPDYLRYGAQVERLGYKREALFQIHGMYHVLRVLMLSLIYYHNSGDILSDADKRIMIYFSLFHDIGRENEDVDGDHGRRSVELIHRQGLRIQDLPMSKKDYRIAEMLIEHHCHADEEGETAIRSASGLSMREKEHAVHLYQVCKDMDGLDRVRFNGLDYRMLRTPYGRRLPLVAGGLLQEKLELFDAEAISLLRHLRG